MNEKYVKEEFTIYGIGITFFACLVVSILSDGLSWAFLKFTDTGSMLVITFIFFILLLFFLRKGYKLFMWAWNTRPIQRFIELETKKQTKKVIKNG